MRKILTLVPFFVPLIFTSTVRAQTTLTVQQTQAEAALVDTAKTLAADQKAFNDKLQQARSDLDKQNKSMADEITALQKKVDANNQAAATAFNTATYDLQKKITDESALVRGLQDVVKKESKLPDNAVFDVTKPQPWSVPPEPKKDEVKK